VQTRVHATTADHEQLAIDHLCVLQSRAQAITLSIRMFGS
jgi:hypothetical protein